MSPLSSLYRIFKIQLFNLFFFQNLLNIKQKSESITYLFCYTKEPPVLTIMNRQKYVQVSIIYVKRITYIYNCPTVIPPMKDTYTGK